MPAGIGYSERPFVHPRRLNEVREIMRKQGGNKNRRPKPAANKRPVASTQLNMENPMSRIAWQLHNMRRQRYLADINSKLRQINGTGA